MTVREKMSKFIVWDKKLQAQLEGEFKLNVHGDLLLLKGGSLEPGATATIQILDPERYSVLISKPAFKG